MELDEAWPATAEGDLAVGYTIPKGSTRKAAMEKIYFESVVANKKILSDAMKVHLEALKPRASKQAFLGSCQKYEAQEGLVHLPLEPPVAATRDEEALAAKVEEMYAKIIIKLEDEKEAEAAAKKKDEERTKRRDEELSRANPGNLLSNLIEEKLEKLTKNREDCGTGAMEEDGDGLPAAALATRPTGSSAASEAKSLTVNLFCDAIAAMAKNGGSRGGKSGSRRDNAKDDYNQNSWVASSALQKWANKKDSTTNQDWAATTGGGSGKGSTRGTGGSKKYGKGGWQAGAAARAQR